mgnify:CR=1 FL=1
MKTNRIEILTHDSLYILESKSKYSYEILEKIVNDYETLIFDGVSIDCNEIVDISINEYEYISKRSTRIYPIKYGRIYYRTYRDICFE